MSQTLTPATAATATNMLATDAGLAAIGITDLNDPKIQNLRQELIVSANSNKLDDSVYQQTISDAQHILSGSTNNLADVGTQFKNLISGEDKKTTSPARRFLRAIPIIGSRIHAATGGGISATPQTTSEQIKAVLDLARDKQKNLREQNQVLETTKTKLIETCHNIGLRIAALRFAAADLQEMASAIPDDTKNPEEIAKKIQLTGRVSQYLTRIESNTRLFAVLTGFTRMIPSEIASGELQIDKLQEIIEISGPIMASRAIHAHAQRVAQDANDFAIKTEEVINSAIVETGDAAVEIAKTTSELASRSTISDTAIATLFSKVTELTTITAQQHAKSAESLTALTEQNKKLTGDYVSAASDQLKQLAPATLEALK